jgi:hypothetical protein
MGRSLGLGKTVRKLVWLGSEDKREVCEAWYCAHGSDLIDQGSYRSS